jgi:hypothetical protein
MYMMYMIAFQCKGVWYIVYVWSKIPANAQRCTSSHRWGQAHPCLETGPSALPGAADCV